jgi:hypothetical protein
MKKRKFIFKLEKEISDGEGSLSELVEPIMAEQGGEHKDDPLCYSFPPSLLPGFLQTEINRN